MASVEGSTHLPNHHFRISLMMLLGVVESEKRVKNLILVCDNMGHLVQDVTLSLFCPFTWVVCCYQPFNLQGGGVENAPRIEQRLPWLIIWGASVPGRRAALYGSYSPPHHHWTGQKSHDLKKAINPKKGGIVRTCWTVDSVSYEKPWLRVQSFRSRGFTRPVQAQPSFS